MSRMLCEEKTGILSAALGKKHLDMPHKVITYILIRPISAEILLMWVSGQQRKQYRSLIIRTEPLPMSVYLCEKKMILGEMITCLRIGLILLGMNKIIFIM